MIPRPFIDDLVARSDIVEIIDSYVTLRKKGKNYTACCPFHEEKTPSFSVNQDKQFYYCFGCGASGNVLSFLMNYARLDFVDAVHELAGRAGLSVPQEVGDGQDSNQALAQRQQREAIYPVLAQAAAYYRQQLQQHPQAARAQAYVRQRGLNPEVVAEFGLGYAPPGWDSLLQALGTTATQRNLLFSAGLLASKDGGDSYDRFRDRLMFPIHDPRGRIVGFGGRVLDDSKPKYLNSPETAVFQKSQELYGLYHVRQQRPAVEQVVVVEGYMDVVALAQYGIRNAVATLGTATGPDHLNRLFRSVSRVVFCFDGDEAGRKAAWRGLEVVLPLLREGREAGFMFLPTGQDPDSLVRQYGAAEFLRLQEQATPLSDFLFQHLLSQVDVNRLEGRARLLELATPLVDKLPPGTTRQFVQDRLRDVDTRNVSQRLPTADDADAGRAQAFQRVADRRPGPVRQRNALSPMRSAVGLLVQNPALGLEVEASVQARLQRLELPGLPLLLGLLEFIQAKPHVQTGTLLEHWRGTEYADSLQKLAAWEHHLPDAGVTREFTDALQRLLETGREQRLDALLQKSRLDNLSPAEKQELKSLLDEAQAAR